MTDNSNDKRGRRTRGPGRGGSSGKPDRPFSTKSGDAGGRSTNTLPEPPEPAEERIAKTIARAGIASRRDAEAMIAEGRVTLNGEVLTSPAVNVTAADKITVDGEPLPAKERTRLWIFHKPRGLVTTARDPEGRPTVFDVLPEELPRVVAVGRLDINTEGLLLLTNDGGLARVIAHPETGWMRRYRIRAYGDVTQADLDRLRDGITVDEMEYGPVEATLDRVQGDNVWITMGLREGKNREVKRILEHLGLTVNRLIRLSFGPFQLGDLEPGLVDEVKTKVLKEQLGQKLAAEAGVDFESPVREPIAPFGSPKGRERQDERPRREDRPERDRGRRFDDRPQSRGHERDRSWGGGKRDERASAPAGRPDRPPPRERPRSVWRDDDATPARKGAKAPRRGADPRAARTASAERPRERVGAIAAGKGRKVLVERLVRSKDEPPRENRRERGREGRAPAGDDRLRWRDGGASRHGAARHAQEDRPDRRPGRSDRPPQERFRDGAPHRSGGERFGGGPGRDGSHRSRSHRDDDRGPRPRGGPGGGNRARKPGGFGKRPGGPKGPPRGRK
jgi:23S rRNA pseudouridine2605 synthase